MSATVNILVVGVGGQGIVLAGDIIAHAALHAGFDAKKSEIHGMSQRGGSVFSHVRYGRRVFSPVISKGEADILVSLEEMETVRWLDYINTDSIVLVCSTRILPANVTDYPEGIMPALREAIPNLIEPDPQQVEQAAGGKKYLNTAVAGILSRFLTFDADAWTAAVAECVPAAALAPNRAAFEAGRSFPLDTRGIRCAIS